MSLYEGMMDKFGYHQDIIDHIVNNKTQEPSSLLFYLIDKIPASKINWQIIYEIICQLCETDIRYIREYWNIFYQLYNYSNVKPNIHKAKYIILVLFSKKFNFDIEWNHKYECCHYKCFDQVLNYYESDPFMRCIIHDDINYLKTTIRSYQYFDCNMKVFGKSLIENCCFCGAVECFKLLRANGIEITKNCLDYSIFGRNKFIIYECLQSFKPDAITMRNIIEIHNFKMAVSFEQKFGLEINISDIVAYFDIRLFFYLMSKSTDFTEFLLYSIHFHNNQLINAILELSANVIEKTKNSQLLLYEAAHCNNVDAIARFVELGANMEARDNDRKTPLFHAVHYNSVKAIKKLVKLGAKIEAKDTDGNTPLIEAAYYNNVNAIKKLVKLGANKKAKDNYGRSPLSIAASRNNVEAIIELIKLGANIEAKDKNGQTPLSIAAITNSVEAIAKLIQFHAKIEAKDPEGKTPLLQATLHNNIEAISKLVELHANIEAKDKNGHTPLFYAAYNNNIEAITKLFELGANINAKDKFGRTPFSISSTMNEFLETYSRDHPFARYLVTN